MMFKIINKKRYEALIEENIKLSTEIESMRQLENVNNGHVCDEFCIGCKHRVKNDDIYDLVYGGGRKQYFCDLNRTCEDYEEEGPEVQWKGTGVKDDE